jgi:hypothetical protein
VIHRSRGSRLALVALLASAGCSSTDTTSVHSDLAIFVGESAPAAAGADWILLDAEIQGDMLAIELQYAGGCALHDFRLLAVDGWIDLPTQGPTPTVAVPLRIAHDDHGDRCEAAIVEALRFHLGPLRDAYRRDRGPGPARLLLRVPVRQGAGEFVELAWELVG